MPLSKFNNEDYVAKYTTLDRVIKDILPFNEIRVSSAHNVNDPYEKDKEWLQEDVSLGNTTEEIYKTNEIFSDIKNKIFSHIKLFCVTGYRQKKTHERDVSDHIYCKPRMWATYGDNHKGICLIFDKNDLTRNFENQEKSKEFKNICNKEVDYLNFLSHVNNNIFVTLNELKKFYKGPTEYDAEKLLSLIDNNYLFRTKYFRKHSDWESESEYRWLVFSKDIEDLNINYGNSLKAIVLGINVESKYECIFKKFTSIPLYKISFEDSEYKISKLTTKDCK